jgi:hypothetical protein
LGKTWKIAYQNVLGEFSLSLLLGVHLPEERARKSATGWGGDQVLLLEDEAGKEAAFVNTVWDTVEQAERFFLAMQEWFQDRYPKAQRSDENPFSFSLVQDGEFHAMRREGANVHFIIGLPEADGQAWSGVR